MGSFRTWMPMVSQTALAMAGRGLRRPNSLKLTWPTTYRLSDSPTSRLALLTYPLPAPALRPHPGGRVGDGAGVEDVVLGERGAEPGPRLELEQPIRPTRSVDRRRHQIGLAAGHAQHVLARLSVTVGSVIDDGDQFPPPPGGRVAVCSHRRPAAGCKMPAEGPAGGLLPVDFDEAVTVLSGRHDPLAAVHHRRNRCVLTRALPEIEIRRGDDLARAAPWVALIPVSAGLPAASTLLQFDDARLVERFVGRRDARREQRLRRHVAGEDVAFELTVAGPIPAVLCLAVDRERCPLRQPQEGLSPALRGGTETCLSDGRRRSG